MTVHMMQYGMTACMEMLSPPAAWPDGHRWSSDWKDVTCKACLAGKDDVVTFRIDANPQAIGGHTFTCLRCNRTSYSQKDVEHHYCGFCEVSHDDIWPPARRWWLNNPRPDGPLKGHDRGDGPRVS